MYPDRFDYYDPASVEEALDLLEEHSDQETELISGGHSLLPTMKSGLSSPDVLVDIGGIDELVGIEDEDDSTRFGALTTYAAVAASEHAREHTPAVARAAAAIGDVQVRNRGTVGGNVAHADPASDLPGAVLASEATIHAQGPDGSREIPADDFFLGMYMTALEPEEILTAIEVPNGGVGAYAKKPSPSSGYAMVGVAALLHTDNGTIDTARVGANGAMDHGIRLPSVEAALEGADLEAATAEEAASHATEDVDVAMLMDDLQASNEYRAQLLEVYTRRALEDAIHRA